LIEFRNTLQNETAKSMLNDPELQELRANIEKLKAKLEDEAEERYYLPAREKWESERLKYQFTLTNPPSQIQFNFP
jgi:predicted nuclease with TOPRIM domain